VERVALNTVPTPENEAYLRTKRERMGHHIDMHDGKGEGK
jgi:GTP cyclohydrolase II